MAPGTAGSLSAVAIGIVLARWFGWRPWYFAPLAGALLLPSVWAAGETESKCGRRDPRLVVVDEVLGQWVALAGAAALNWKSWLAAFLLFRAFDIWKPWPVNRLESLPGGAGIVADDLMAGVYAALVLWLAGCFNLY
jgi:phosphatidylglycerophosphatase A